jgi:adenine deaminase
MAPIGTRLTIFTLALVGSCLALSARSHAVVQADPIYDILLKNGNVLDPSNGRNGRLDIAIVNDRIVRIGSPPIFRRIRPGRRSTSARTT